MPPDLRQTALEAAREWLIVNKYYRFEVLPQHEASLAALLERRERAAKAEVLRDLLDSVEYCVVDGDGDYIVTRAQLEAKIAKLEAPDAGHRECEEAGAGPSQ